ncbi:hypothetical protein SKAU_G00147890 [Synaphobranchus kaupii]|uniref:Uncharacterized protein n=1 Tax=Synaphobranchus kaupii TaxID=118154 RepID=A0A9Q1J4Y0_SYNKA|nr:hypothetical protein SKAU_G00147890 [Synaphobranchus kaupii]
MVGDEWRKGGGGVKNIWTQPLHSQMERERERTHSLHPSPPQDPGEHNKLKQRKLRDAMQTAFQLVQPGPARSSQVQPGPARPVSRWHFGALA